ncbi:asparagine synthase (glutamine-hydrolysing) [Saccharopolyspora antimicrobica]|uniref:asparagine synthase (glutamine-hydrolyzing) n=1 Tax=Saccharopolyspora antimicrobica TaxID=455193 RepID=A0A1I4T5W0_9PSEU|nr:asparagine synthase (glutamine-hydrolyzing) [Saccharopolyspora antimicrobica]RKT85849.1 asparagine synthase (glutamine-hydrolysing) [Saccharopolyspora antimicrobica]SFM72112.1 asparagine synthase (glutamine-hydrolysing) [Saccharopolyspora antimicrobica]
MCGISGWIDFQRDLTRERLAIDAMCDTMSCRGPDARGTWVAPHAALGHRRLAIIDLPGGTQPMASPDGDVVIVYSGEAYNFTELRDELRRRGHRFTTDSDTEVVLHGYLEWGPQVAEQLNGMFAFAVWDARTEQLLLVRDRMGIKPLYYYPTEQGVLFGSEPKAILANPLAEKVVDADGLRELFTPVKTPRQAVWAGMREVEPGTVVTVDRTGLHERTYWQLRAVEHTDDQQGTVRRVRELLDDIVARQLIADVPRCVLLSGGLDSSAITALAGIELGRSGEQVRSFAVDFAGQAENFVPDELRATPDTPYVHDVAQHVGSAHQDIVLDPDALADPAARRATVQARDLPMGLGDMDQSLYLLFKAIRQHSTVALSGESADEVFGGYRWFHDPEVRAADTFPWMASVRTPHDDHPQVLDPHVRDVLDLESYVADRYREAIAAVPVLDGESAAERRMREISHLHLTRFVRILLDRKDRMSMAVGLEVRVPFCDHRLVEYVFNAPWSLKTFDGREKSLLRHATADALPQSVVERVKSPYPSTQDPRYAAVLQRQVADLAATGNEALSLLDGGWLREALALDPEHIDTPTRFTFERALDMATWFDIHHPTIKL